MARHCTLGGVAHIVETADYRADFQVVEGYLDGIDNVRGEDDVLPYEEGRIEGDYIEDFREIVIEGYLEGRGTTWALQQAHFWTQAAVLSAAWRAAQLVGTTLSVELAGTGVTKVATVKVRAIMPQDLIGGVFRRWTISCDSIVYPVWT